MGFDDIFASIMAAEDKAFGNRITATSGGLVARQAPLSAVDSPCGTSRSAKPLLDERLGRIRYAITGTTHA